MAEIALKKLLEESGKVLYQVSKSTGIHYERLMQYRDKTAVQLSLGHVEPLCREFNCTPGELLVLSNGNGKKLKRRRL